ncbi:membrane protein insertase YidC [Porphyromonadaceae bacterium OttesenSCG-928-L07]|nr:membrane protein insertase YidC [Porphyromonadaceae bacterium OttesenSCG-928-L07]MDL2330725.1 membrane protein insertase YidC [Odoribacter sp. OttesenSCG-928-A06]
MDKNTIVGLVLIFLILIGFSYFNSPSEEEQLRQAERLDSIARVEAERVQLATEQEKKLFEANQTTAPKENNSVFKQENLEEKTIILENDKIKLKINTLGGRIEYVELKEYVTHDSLPLVIWQAEKSAFSLSFYANRREVMTEKVLFTPGTEANSLYAKNNAESLSMRLYSDEDKYLEYAYTLAPDSYVVDFSIRTHNMNEVIDMNSSFLTLSWGVDMPQLEKSKDFENRYTGVYYNFLSNEVEHMSMNADESESLKNKIKWIAFKQQFFSSVLIAKESFNEAELSSKVDLAPKSLKQAYAQIPLQYSGNANENYDMQFYFGPNSFNTLKEYGKDIELHKLVDLGWKWLAWVNRYVVIPVFHFLENHVTNNYGLIILLLTLIIKLFLFPLTYKSYLSQAKMRVLKPQIDEISAKYPADKAMEKQQAVMALYRKAGINPMGGCLPMLLQMPILIALFWFFPGAIELRQKSFLWATDLASYDSIIDLPFSIPFYGDHVSLFCLLMTAVNIIYMIMNNKNQPQNDNMKGMKMMMYIMPVMFLFIFNNYSSGLSYYYLVTTLITIIQTWAISKYMHDDKLRKQIEVAKTKPVKKSSFQQRLEQAQKVQQQRLREQQGKR